MPEPEKLPIEKLTLEEFSEFKKKYLDNDKLTAKDINEIKKLFNLKNKATVTLCCDEMHGHSYRCIHYYIPQSGVVERLIGEIEYYQNSIKDLSKKIKDI